MYSQVAIQLWSELWDQGSVCDMFPSCTDEIIDSTRRRFQAEMNQLLPIWYANLLKISDGFNCNGGCIYSSSSRSYSVPTSPYSLDQIVVGREVLGIIEANESLREIFLHPGELTVFGHNDGEFFVGRKRSDEFAIISRDDVNASIKWESAFAFLQRRFPSMLVQAVFD